MTNNPTIDGVSRELIKDIHEHPDCPVEFIDHLRRLLDAPAVERQEPIGELEIYGYQCRQSEQEKFFLCEYPQFWQHIALVRKDDAEAQTSALQSTIARLEARVAELESGRGEFIHQVRTHGSDCWEDISGESLEVCQCQPEEYEIRKLFTAPPAPVAVVLPDRKPRVTTTEESDSHVRMLEQIERNGWNACLDATAALNGERK